MPTDELKFIEALIVAVREPTEARSKDAAALLKQLLDKNADTAFDRMAIALRETGRL